MSFVRLISLVVLLVQGFALAHLSQAAHSFDELGGVFEHETLAQETHDDEQGHVCADVTVASSDAQGCPVISTWRAASQVPGLITHAVTRSSSFVPRVTQAPSHHAVAPLVVAPKSSPPVS